MLIRLLLILQLTLLATAQSPDARIWHVRLADDTNVKLLVSNNSGTIEFRDDQKLAFAIPDKSILEIVHTTERIRRSTKTYDSFDKICCGGTDSHLLPALAMAIASPMGTAKAHYVEIRWYHNGDDTAALKLAKDEYLPFMDWLQQLSGTKWQDIAQEREQAVKAIEQHSGAAFQVIYEGSKYLVLPLDDRDYTKLYIFKGAVKSRNIVAIMPVVREFSTNDCVAEVELLYGRCRDKHCDIDAILLPTVTYHYRPTMLKSVTVTNATGETESACAKLQKQKAAEERRVLEKDYDEPSEKPLPTLKRKD